MTWMRALGATGMEVSAVGLGTVKFGRDQGLNYPDGFTIPDQRSAKALLDKARNLGINLIDTAPAYGRSEERLGNLLSSQRQHWLICTKVGEEFERGRSSFDFSPEYTRLSVTRSLRRLRTEVIDIVLVHSNGDDLQIIHRLGTLEALAQLKREGVIRAFGISTKTVAGGLAAAEVCDAIMLTYNLAQKQELPVLDACGRVNCGVLVKKVLASGHLSESHDDPVQASMNLVLGHTACSAAIIGTIDTHHLQTDVAAARRALAQDPS